MAKRRPGIEIPGDPIRDLRLQKLAEQTGFATKHMSGVNRLLAFVAYEVSHCRTPGQFYRALSAFYEYTRRRKKPR